MGEQDIKNPQCPVCTSEEIYNIGKLDGEDAYECEGCGQTFRKIGGELQRCDFVEQMKRPISTLEELKKAREEVDKSFCTWRYAVINEDIMFSLIEKLTSLKRLVVALADYIIEKDKKND
jgi:hypothetical protein